MSEQTHAGRLEYIRTVTDRVMELWPAESRDEGVVDSPELVEAMKSLNEVLSEGESALVGRLLAENVAYRLLVDQEITELPMCDLSFGHESSQHPDMVSMALGWVASAARKNADYVFATSMTSFKSEFMTMAIMALLDAGAAIRDGKATITLTPPDPRDEPTEEPGEVVTTAADHGE